MYLPVKDLIWKREPLSLVNIKATYSLVLVEVNDFQLKQSPSL